MNKLPFILFISLLSFSCSKQQSATIGATGLLSRLMPEKSAQVKFEIIEQTDADFFELETVNGTLNVRGNNQISLATGLRWYLKYYCNAQISWAGKNIELPEHLPTVKPKVRKSTEQTKRFYFNYCTYSYSMAWWDWERWEKEIDWMALNGINMPLMIVGEEAVWQNTLRRLNYSEDEIKSYLPGPAFFAWFYMNNLEGWGGPLPDNWISDHIELRKKIQKRMYEYGMTPVFQGFYGMVPGSFNKKFPNADIHNPGLWCGFKRPAFIEPTDSLFRDIAEIYYLEQEKLFGKAEYYAGDPFHEGGNIQGVDLKASGDAIYQAMKEVNPQAKWVLQSWQGNPHREMIDHLPEGDIIVVDLHAEDITETDNQKSPMSASSRFGKHDYIWSLTHNFGGNTGMYGKLEEMAERVYKAQVLNIKSSMIGVGATPEGIEQNPVVYELLFELPWHQEKVNVATWVKQYVKARYGKTNQELENAWDILLNTVYACPVKQQGTTESVLCARPAKEIKSVSTWGSAEIYYDPEQLKNAWHLMISQIDSLESKETFRYDLVDITRQVLADLANELHKEVMAAFHGKDLELFEKKSNAFLELILDQDKLLSAQKEFLLGRWIEAARSHGHTQEEEALYEWNSRVQITTWGPREAANDGQLHEYAHKEWAGLLRDFYYPRWKKYFDYLERNLKGEKTDEVDFYKWEEQWTKKQNSFSSHPEGDSMSEVLRLEKKYS
ncbi:alpha-N-acetylglucosaminidase [Marinilabilia salmonicolor]|jgi:alpha-N-acetylglucosaminidase|uniref:alpha-N-acetylglucosaminidase n=1 Tax=Marinilabilia salmonicolor TaxID=989 RepID=UPI000D04F087|nr:alpha-N-acetylglucosaminidase [Marinilabilia salmonicolor]PRY97326.1 alpha-N-acetylglucosaminidase [Marinilabilia salmonicolor]